MTTRVPDASQQAQFPIVESFTQSAPANPHWRLLGSARLNGGSLELTPDETSQAGTAFLDQPFSSTLGVTIDFDYACEGGSAQPGDGFSVYVIDGARTTQPGGIGGALGYSFTKDAADVIVSPGVTAGYVGIGFDNFGNFATQYAGTGGGLFKKPDTVGVRGSGNLREGFRWLTGVAVDGGFRGSWDNGAHVQISIIDGRLTVRHSDRADPNGTLVIDDFDLAGADGQTQMPETFKLGFAAGTGGATASHRIRNLTVALPVNMPLEMSGPQTAKAGDRVSYTIGVQNLGPNDAPDAVVEAAVPAELTAPELTCQGENGAVCGNGSVLEGLRLPIELPRGSKAMVNLTGTVDQEFEGRLTCTSLVKSPTRANTAAQHSDSVTTDVELPPVTVTPVINLPGWPEPWPGAGWIISYVLKLAANEHRVVRWEIHFEVPERTRINPQEPHWFEVIKDGTDGSVVIATPDDTHTIEPGAGLDVALQLLYPSQHDAGEGTLRNLRAIEVTQP
ncbi:lectin-like domain-containing protein [Streptomyces sp. XH2]|uniref:lectin-like domain-containing protein n=1 Tax=Streptomyces sp. XH2 TaxID=3412483 RepID=UPI003C7BB6C7